MSPPRPLRPRSTLALLGLAALALRAPVAPAQAVVMHRQVRAGDVTGLELSIEGATRAPRGGRVRWLLAVHEVVGLADLRPAPGARVRVLSSLVRDRAVAEVTADALGRAAVDVEVPADAPGSFHVVFEAISDRNIRRQFDLDVTVDPGTAVMLESDRTAVRPGARVHVWGRVVSAVTHLPVPNAEVTIDLLDGHQRLAAARTRVRADGTGAFAHAIVLPREALDRYTVVATTGPADFPASARVGIATVRPEVPTLIVRAAAAQSLARPGEPVSVDVVVRTGDGRPVRGAVVESPRIPPPPDRRPRPPLRTDARGRAHFTFAAPEITTPLQDLPIPVSATRPGLGSASHTASVRVARAQLFAAASVEGGALIPGLPGRVYVRVVGADGGPAPAGVTVALSGPRFPAGLTATTDADGAAVIDATLAAAAPRRPPARAATVDDEQEAGNEAQLAEDACGGTTATSFALALSMGPQRGAASGCLAIDPDATVRVRLPAGPVVTAGTPLRVALARTPGVARLPIEVALLARRGDTLVPLVARVASPGAGEVELTVPPDAVGQVVVRARPLHGPLAMAIRGGVTSAWVIPGARFAIAANGAPGGREVSVETAAQAGGDAVEGTVVVLPRGDGEALLARLRQRPDAAPLGDLRVDPGRASERLVAGALAAATRVDDAAPAVLRAGRVVPVPAPDEPATRGTLRDPWRARARFVEGRLALVFRQIEEHVAASLPVGRDNVAVRGAGGRWAFNREIFDAILAASEESNGSGPRALGGAPLTIEVLQRLDGAFTYDNVARRLTRRRMFAILLALRRFVNEHALDLRWSWRGDPTTWLRSLVDDAVAYDEEGSVLWQRDMVDGWGNPFALRPAPGGRARFAFLSPVPGYELVSAGPDERFGTGDDVVDPFARVLPAGGAYARAVDEDGLLARLHGVELGRATISRLAEVFDVEVYEGGGENESADEARATSDWNAIPSRVEDDPHALDLVRPGVWAEAYVAPLAALAPGATRLPVRVDDEPRTYAVVVDAWSVRGYTASAIARFAAGTPVLVDLPLAPASDGARAFVPRLRVGEPIRVAATVTNLADAPQTFQLEAVGEGTVTTGPLRALVVPAGEVGTFEIPLAAASAGPGAVRLVVRDESGAVLREVRAPLVADTGALPLRSDFAALVRAEQGGRELSLTVPATSRVTAGRLVLEAPAVLADDPEFDRVRRGDPALIAWAYALASRELPPALAAALFQAQVPEGRVVARFEREGGQVPGASTALSTACALVAWSGAGEDDTRAAQARERAARALPGLRGTLADEDPGAGSLREAAAVLAALATGAAGTAGEGDDSVDPVAAYTEQLRDELRDALRRAQGQPTLLARAAAALLLTDPADPRGVAFFEQARTAVMREAPGQGWLRGGQGRTARGEELAGTAALAIAAQQRGEVDLAATLARGLAAHAHVAMRLGGEAAFWLLAATSYGVYGLVAPEAVTVSVDGGPAQRVALAGGRAFLPLAPRPGHATRVRLNIPGREGEGGVAFARLEVLHERPYNSLVDGPLLFTFAGDPGYAGEVSALELTVRNQQVIPVRRAVVELQLPAAAGFDEAARAALAARGNVAAVEVRDGALLRIVFGRLGPGESVEIPLAVRWLGRGTVTGFAAVGYAEERGDRMTVLAPRSIELRPRPEE